MAADITKTTAGGPLSQLELLFGANAKQAVNNARVLVVGSGGIGCELLKNLVMTEFRDIVVIDLDTIDLSNLNRQFLFQMQHIKQPKSFVAAEAVKQFNSDAKVTPYQANIKDPEFDVCWFKQFDLVMNALDNLAARRHVNQMCLAAGKPLIESGTAGYNGQVTVIKGDQTECFDCHEKPVEQKTYPVCTIRSTPSAPIHCIVWAKDYLFSELLSNTKGENITESEVDRQENAEELAKLKQEAEELKTLRESMHKPEFAQMVFEKVFVEDIERLLKMKDMWTNRTPPTVLNYHQLDREAKALAKTNPGSLTADDQAVPTAIQSFILFKTSLEKLAVRVRADNLALSFDKDDDDMLSFVTATANLRATAFGIDNKSRFQVKAMTGNIIPAIATTNAIIAGMMVTQAIFVLCGKLDQCQTTYVTYGGSRPRYFNSERLMPPNAACSVCRKRYMTISIRSFDEVTLGDVVEYLLGLSDGGGKDIGLTDEFTVTEGDRILYDVDFDDNLSKTLRQLSVGRGSCFVVVPEDENIGGSMQWGYSTLAVELMVVENPDLTPCVSIDGLADAAAEYSQARHAGSATKGTKRKHDDGEDSLGVVGADADAEAMPHVKIAATDNAGLPDDDRRVQNHGVSIDIDNDDEVICLD